MNVGHRCLVKPRIWELPSIDWFICVDVIVLLAFSNAVFVDMGCEFCMRDLGAIDQFDVAEKPFGAALCQRYAFLDVRLLFADFPRFVALQDEVQPFLVEDDGPEGKGSCVVVCGVCVAGV